MGNIAANFSAPLRLILTGTKAHFDCHATVGAHFFRETKGVEYTTNAMGIVVIVIHQVMQI